MRALLMNGFGTTGEARIGDMPMPAGGPDLIVVKMAGAGVNPTDYKEVQGHLTGYYPAYKGPWIPGHDGAGVVEAVGGNVRQLSVGDRVMFISNRDTGLQSGTFTEYAVVDGKHAALAPGSISLLEASTIPVAAATSHQALFLDSVGAAKQGQSVLIHGAAGGLGSFAVALCAAEGILAAATCREANASYARDLGAELVIDYQNEDIAAATRAWSADGVDVVLDCVSGGNDYSLFDALKPGGRLVAISMADHDGDAQALQAEAEKRGVIAKFFVLDHSRLVATLDDIRNRIDGRRLRMPEITAYPLAEASSALAAMEAGGIRGKIAIEIAKL